MPGSSADREGGAPEGAAHVIDDLRAALRAALAGRSEEARSAYLDGIALALELSPDRIIAALEGGDLGPAQPDRRRRTVVSNATVDDLLAHAETALPPAREARSMVIDSDHIAGPVLAPWIDRKPFDHWINSATFARDDPEALRALGPRAVATALAGLAEWGQAAGRQDVREVATLIRTWLVEDAGRFDTLDRDLGMSPRDGRRSLSNVAKRAERDMLVIGLSRQKPYADMGARRAAQALRAACAAYEKRRWPVDRQERVSRPQGEPGVWWQVMNLGLPFAMPGEEHLKAMLDGVRATGK